MKIKRTDKLLKQLDKSFFEKLWKISGLVYHGIKVEHFDDKSIITSLRGKIDPDEMRISQDLDTYEATHDGPMNLPYNEVKFINLLLEYGLINVGTSNTTFGELYANLAEELNIEEIESI